METLAVLRHALFIVFVVIATLTLSDILTTTILKTKLAQGIDAHCYNAIFGDLAFFTSMEWFVTRLFQT